MANEKIRMVVLDDDPTGIQTVHGCRLLTVWDVESLCEALDDKARFFYVLTNTRAMTRQDASRVVNEVMENVLLANRDRGYHLIFISRSDSCLRGHFPLETDVMAEVLTRHGIAVWRPIPFVPAFIEAGRVTINGTHYMRDGERLIPLSETEFAHDNVFGYHSSVLSEYITEKGAHPTDYEIVDAESYDQLYAFAHQLLTRLSTFSGAMVIRSSSSLPRALSGISDHPLLHLNDLRSNSNPGVFVVGSHVQKTTQQLNRLLAEKGTAGIEINVEELLDCPDGIIASTLSQVKEFAERGMTPVIYTSRRELRLNDADQRQALGQQVSDALVEIVRQLPFTPSYLVAKGGITSNDILTKGLKVKSATVLGQIIPNVPCVMTRQFPYIIFPGNVGDMDSLVDIYKSTLSAI